MYFGHPSKEALMEVFQTPVPSAMAISNWKKRWENSPNRVAIEYYSRTINFLEANGIDSLFYQFTTEKNTSDEVYWDNKITYVVFYKEEHEVFFKLHYGIS